MDVHEIFTDNPHTRGELFYKLFKKFSETDEEELTELYNNILEQLDEEDRKFIKDNEVGLACYFTALADQYRKEEEYKEEVLEPAYEALNKVEKSITIAGFD